MVPENDAGPKEPVTRPAPPFVASFRADFGGRERPSDYASAEQRKNTRMEETANVPILTITSGLVRRPRLRGHHGPRRDRRLGLPGRVRRPRHVRFWGVPRLRSACVLRLESRSTR